MSDACSYQEGSFACDKIPHFWINTEVFEQVEGNGPFHVMETERVKSRPACQVHVGDVLKALTLTVNPHAHFYVIPVDC